MSAPIEPDVSSAWAAANRPALSACATIGTDTPGFDGTLNATAGRPSPSTVATIGPRGYPMRFPTASCWGGPSWLEPAPSTAAAASTVPVGPSLTGYARHATTTRPGSFVAIVISVGPCLRTGTRDSLAIQPDLVWITRTAICCPRE